MTDPSEEFRRKLLGFDEMSPTLRDEYRRQIDVMLNPPLTRRAAVAGGAVAVAFVLIAALLVRGMFVRHVMGLMLIAHATLAGALLWGAVLIARDLLKRKHTPKAASSIAGAFYAASGLITVVAMLLGLAHASEPKTLYGVFYVFVFFFGCAMWKLETHITDSALAAREQSLRVECRLVDLAEKMAG